ncbi:hypothetical protein D3C85_1875680 [compost metagenome]
MGAVLNRREIGGDLLEELNQEVSGNLPSKWELCARLTSWKFKGKYYRSISLRG